MCLNGLRIVSTSYFTKRRKLTLSCQTTVECLIFQRKQYLEEDEEYIGNLMGSHLRCPEYSSTFSEDPHPIHAVQENVLFISLLEYF